MIYAYAELCIYPGLVERYASHEGLENKLRHDPCFKKRWSKRETNDDVSSHHWDWKDVKNGQWQNFVSALLVKENPTVVDQPSDDDETR